VAYAPVEARAWFERRAPWALRRPQPQGDLGARLRAALGVAFREGARRCVVIGTDTPHLRAEALDEAFRALDEADVCLGPSPDGGYHLIGLTAERPRLFEDVPWSTDAVQRVTLQRAAECGLRLCELAEEFDVDEGPDLERLVRALRERPDAAPATRAVLFGRNDGG
jgi:rSAM/selenodomain-associated transferase 1